MKIFIVLAACIWASYAADVQILRNDQNVNPDGSYQYAYETSNGISAQESGSLKNADTNVAHGSFAFTSPEGENIQISYIADENGFQPSGNAIPVSPEVPVLIQRALAYIASHPPAPERKY